MEALGKWKRGNDDDAGGAGCLSGDQSDRLSALPDCLLHEIMSHMKAQQVVQTCVLGKRWRHLWRSMPCLDVDQCDFETPGEANNQYRDCESWEKFEDFMDALLAPGNVSIALLDTLCLNTSPSYGHGHHKPAPRWIRRDIMHHPAQEPAGVQRGAALSYNSWRLRRLHLSNQHLSNLFAEHVGTRCQQLEDLELKGCNCDFHAITSDSLKNLVLDGCELNGLSEIATPMLTNLLIMGSSTNFHDGLLVITAPALVSMLLRVTPYNFTGGLSFGEMPSLAKILQVTDEGFVQFNNLRALELTDCYLSDDFQTLGHFLRNSPKLERLTLRLCKYSNDPKEKKESSNSKNIAETPPCPNLVDVQCNNLKLTEIIYRQDDDIHQLIEILLRVSGN
ncbi:hypothetical protein HU200_027326 [Digitaria exilis]|uniref:F-box domain-containing protein n=1 Tax=Digitaria exilis TaxID=1010633 RepID=A0A835ETD8_9POAL|nr:hypothetical protein HU200_027326 [Digitaria exilis]